MGIVCLLLAVGLWAVSLWAGNAGASALVGGFSFGNGAVFGGFLAMVTRTRRPVLIYLLFLLALLSLTPLLLGWPPVLASSTSLPASVPGWLKDYPDILRLLLFLLGIPYPFARLGYHAPDPAEPL
jgi:hypothetical protein